MYVKFDNYTHLFTVKNSEGCHFISNILSFNLTTILLDKSVWFLYWPKTFTQTPRDGAVRPKFCPGKILLLCAVDSIRALSESIGKQSFKVILPVGIVFLRENGYKVLFSLWKVLDFQKLLKKRYRKCRKISGILFE